jgi:CRISPR-associated protein Csb1
VIDRRRRRRNAMKTLTLDDLTIAVGGSAAAVRAVARLEPAGGTGDKVFPPTYMKEGQAKTRYACEQRRVDGRLVDTVLLDSVASQANRMEEALLEGWRAKELHFPVVWVD